MSKFRKKPVATYDLVEPEAEGLNPKKTRRLAADVLERAAKRVMWGWTQGAYAVDGGGCEVDACAPHARAWCASGACFREFDAECDDRQPAFDVLDAAREALETETGVGGAGSAWKNIGEWNDSPMQTQKNVSDAMLRAAKALRAEEAICA